MKDVTEAPPSLSVYRGHSRSGLGEGPDTPIARGEQYLAASPELRDVQILRLIRPWMTHDLDPAHLRDTNDQLEGWAAFRMDEYRFVVRLVPAGRFTDRAAYFAHGRAWRIGEGRRGFDPGGLLGESAAFEAPWRNDERGPEVPVPWPRMVRPEQVRDEVEVAVRFLAWLYQCRVGDRPLVVAAPVGEFRSGGPLHALVSLARAGLPEHLKRDCTVRVYTRLPDLFLNQLGAGLVVLPQAFAGEALSARRDAVLLDRQGECHSAQKLDPRAEAYARAVVSRALALPAGLMLFSERFRDHSGAMRELPGPDDLRTLTLTYNVAFALAGSEGRLGDLLAKFLVPQAEKSPDLPWERLVDAEEWLRFPASALADVALRTLDGGGRALQARIEEAMGSLSLTVDDRLDGWWDAADRAKHRRLIELFHHRPPLASAAALTQCLAEVPLVGIDPREAAQVLRAELESGCLARRSAEARTLADLIGQPGALDVLGEATVKGVLTPSWARQVLEAPAHPDDPQRLAEYLLACVDDWPVWGGLPRELLRHDLVQGFATPTLLRLGRELTPDDRERLLLIYQELDRRMAARPEATTRDLIAGGWWLAWQRRATDFDVRQAGLAWLRCPIWHEESPPEPTREAWKRVMEDLGGRLTNDEIAALCHDAADHPHVRWPWAPPFEVDQIAEFAAHAQYLDGLAYLAEAIRIDPAANEIGSPVHQLLLEKSLWEGSLPADALLWLLEPMPGDDEKRPRLSRDEARHLIECTVTEPLRWRAKRSLPPEEVPVEPRRPRPPLDLTNLTDRVVAALSGRPDVIPWEDLGGQIEEFRHSDPCAADRHPLAIIARHVRQLKARDSSSRAALESRGWQIFERSARPSFFALDPSSSLAALALASSLMRGEALGLAALGVMFANGSKAFRRKDDWWRAFFHSFRVEASRRRPAGTGDSGEIAMVLVLERYRELSQSESEIFERLFKEEAEDWDLAAELGVPIMKRTISFFYRQRERAGFAEKLELRLEGTEFEIYVFSRKPLEADHSELLERECFGNSADYRTFRGRLEQAVREKGGGIVATVEMADRKSGELAIEIDDLWNQGARPDKYLLLAPGCVADFYLLGLKRGKAELRVHSGAHVVLPVDREAQTHLEGLYDHLGWLSPDAEALVLNTIWRASLAQRVSRLEEHVVRQASSRVRPEGWLGKVHSLADRFLPRSSWLLAAGLVLLLLLNFILVVQVRSLKGGHVPGAGTQGAGTEGAGTQGAGTEGAGTQGAGTQGAGTQGAGGNVLPPTGAAPGGQDEVGNDHADNPKVQKSTDDEFIAQISDALARLNEVWSLLDSTKGGGLIYATHVKSNLARSVEDLGGNEPFAWGFVKLFLLEKGKSLSGYNLSNTEWRSKTKDLLIETATSLKAGERSMLAFVTCRAFKLAGLPEESEDDTPQRVELGIACEQVSPSLALDGLNSLISGLEASGS